MNSHSMKPGLNLPMNLLGFICLALAAFGCINGLQYIAADNAAYTWKFAIITLGPIFLLALVCGGLHSLQSLLPRGFNEKMAPLNAKVRDFLWPVHGIEHFKFIPLTLMVSFILFNFTVLRTMKDTLVVTTVGSELITFIKVYAVLPAAILFFLLFTKLANVFSKQTLFYGVILFFVSFFILFAAVLYPYQEYVLPLESCDALIGSIKASIASANAAEHIGFMTKVKTGFLSFSVNLILMVKYWSFSVFYIMAELWGSVVSALLFWQFANSIVKVSEAKRFYGHFYLLANIATALSGTVSTYFSNIGKASGLDNVAAYGITLNYMVTIIASAAILVMFLYYFMEKYVVTNPKLFDASEIKPKKKKLKLSMGESIKFILGSRYLLLIATLVISYGITINLVEVAWKDQLKAMFTVNGVTDKNAYQAYVGDFFFYSGVSTFLVILLGGQLLRWLGWRVGAVATPILIGITGTVFFICMIYKENMDPLISMLGTTTLVFTVFMGALQNILSKSTKYALFDPTKEMSYIPLDEESKLKGKAAVDVVGGRLGKAGGSFMQTLMFSFIGPISVIAPYSLGIMLAFVVVWIVAVVSLHKRFVAMGGEKAWKG